MANPQTENGYTRIANELLEALIRYEISGQEMRAVLFIMRKTYGYSKIIDLISLSQVSKALHISKTRASQIMASLIEKRVITVQENMNGVTRKISINKDFSQWETVHKNMNRSSFHIQPFKKTCTQPFIFSCTTKEKRNYTKENADRKKSDPRISQLIKFFHDTVSSLKNFKPKIGKADAGLLKQRLSEGMAETEIQGCITHYLHSEKSSKSGITLKACLSDHSINLFRARICKPEQPEAVNMLEVMRAEEEKNRYEWDGQKPKKNMTILKAGL